MKRCAILLVLLAAAWTATAQAQQGPTTAPAAAPAAAAPAQCPVSGATTAAAAAPAQCPVSGATTAPAAGKPMSAAMAQMLGLTPPAGADATPSASSGPSTQPVASSASISIQAVQGTKDAPKITGGKATVHLYNQAGDEFRSIDVNLDEHGVAILENISLSQPFQPVVTIEHAGVSYEGIGEPMTPTKATQKIEVPLYETTDKRPDYKIQMRHVVVKATTEGLRVMDYLIVNNPADRTWTGVVGPDGKPATMWVALPAGAKDLDMDGAFHPGCTSEKDGKLISTDPLVPGQSQFRVAYLVPGQGGNASMTIDAPAPVGGMMLMVPEDQAGYARVEGLEKGEAFPANGGGTMMRAFMGRDIVPGQKIVLNMTGLPENAEAESFWSTPKVVGIVGGGILLVICVIFLVAKPGRKPGQAEAQV